MSRQQEGNALDKCIELVTDLCGERPVGYVAPWWELSPNTIALLLERNFLYDRGMIEDDYLPHYLRRGDSWTKINYALEAKDWMKAWKAGEEVELVELVSRRCTANDVRQDIPQQPWLGKSTRCRGHLARSIQLLVCASSPQ